MSDFTSLLNRLNQKLALPQPVKSRILLEIAADLEDAADYFKQQGISPADAQQKAIEKFSLEEESLAELVRIHQSMLQRFIDKISIQARNRWEKILLFLILLMIATFSTRAIFTTPFLRDASPFIWGTAGICLVGLGLGIVKFYQFYIKKSHNIRTLRNGLPALFFLSGLNLFSGILGNFIELFRVKDHAVMLSTELLYLITIHSPESYQKLIFLTNSMTRNSSMIMVSLLGTIFLAVCWFVLENKAGQIVQAELSAMQVVFNKK